MSEDGDEDFSEGRDTSEQEPPQGASCVSSSPEDCQGEAGDSREVSREDVGIRELDSSEENTPPSAASNPPMDSPGEDEFGESSKVPSLGNSPPLGDPVGDAQQGSSGSALVELNKIAAILNRCSMTSGRLRLFQMYFREPGMTFFVKPEGRRRHNAGRQTSRQPPADPTQQEEGPGCEWTSRDVPMPILNQAGAVVGYTGPMPKRQPLDDESEAGEQAVEPKHSFGSSETIPIEEVYLPSFSSLFLPEESIAPSGGCLESGSFLSGACESPSETQLRRGNLGTTQAVDIPGRPGSDPVHSGSFPSARPVLLTRRYSLEFEPRVPSCSADQSVPKRKISQDSSTGSGKHCSLSIESSVDLETYMTSNLQYEADSESSTGNRKCPSSDSPPSLAFPHLGISPEQTQTLDSTVTLASDSAQMPVPQGSEPAATHEGESPEIQGAESLD